MQKRKDEGEKRNETQNEKRTRKSNKISVSAYTNGVHTTAVSIQNPEGTCTPNVVHTRAPATDKGDAD